MLIKINLMEALYSLLGYVIYPLSFVIVHLYSLRTSVVLQSRDLQESAGAQKGGRACCFLFHLVLNTTGISHVEFEQPQRMLVNVDVLTNDLFRSNIDTTKHC